jgi:hypothetical protein
MSSACPSCGSTVAAAARTCPNCGASIASPVQLATPRPTGLPVPEQRPPSTAGRPTVEVLAEGARAGARGGVRLFRRLSPHARVVVFGVLAVLLVGVPAALWVVGTVAYGPAEPVEELVAALNDGDVERAATLARCTSRLCRPDALHDGYRAPTGVSVTAVAEGGASSPGTADVRIAYEVAGERRESVVRVRQESGLFLREWTIVSGATGYLEVLAPGAKSARIAGTDVAVPAGGRTASTQALIGAYTVAAGTDDPLYEAAPATVAVAGDLRNRTVTSVELTLTVRPKVREDVTGQVTAFLDQCRAQPDARPRAADADCPFAYGRPLPTGATAQTWTLLDPPTVELARPERAQPDVVLEVRTTKVGHAQFSYTYDGTVYEADPVEVSVRGVVWLDTGTVRFVPAG